MLTIVMYQMRILTTQVSSVMLRSKKLEIRKTMRKLKEQSNENQKECHEIEPNTSKDTAMPQEIILRFEMKLQSLLFLDSSIHIRILKQVPQYLATGLFSGTSSPLADSSTLGLKCKTNTLTILIHKLHILTTQISSVLLRSKKLEIWGKNVKTERAVG
jgi:hypothetical protein